MDQEKFNQWLERVVGKRHVHCRFDNYILDFEGDEPEQAKVRKAFYDKVLHWSDNTGKMITSGTNLMMFGKKGTGKDHLMVSILRRVMQERVEFCHFTGYQMATMFHERKRQGKVAYPSKMAEKDILFISDIEMAVGTGPKYQYQYELGALIDERYNAVRPIVFTSNLQNPDQMKLVFGERSMDRLLHEKVLAPASWQSYRVSPECQAKQGGSDE